MRNLFMPFSPYHLLLIYALAAEDKSGAENILVPSNGNARMASALDVFTKLFPDVKFNIVKMKSADSRHVIPRALANRKNLKTIKKYIAGADDIAKFYYSCEWNVYTVYVSNALMKGKNPPECHFIEDGIATYAGERIKPKHFIEWTSEALFYGSWYKGCAVPGHLNSGAIIEALRPDLLPEVYANDKKHRVNLSSLKSKFRMDNLPDKVLDFIAEGGIDTLIALDSSYSHTNDEYFGIVRDIIMAATARGYRVAIKRHPHDIKNSTLIKYLNVSTDLIELPSYLPVEMFYYIFNKTLKMVIGGMGTSVFTAKQLLPHVEAISIAESPRADDAYTRYIIKLFESAGISVKFLG